MSLSRTLRACCLALTPFGLTACLDGTTPPAAERRSADLEDALPSPGVATPELSAGTPLRPGTATASSTTRSRSTPMGTA